MPLEIKELHIKATITEQPSAGSSQPSSAVSGQEDIIKACVEKVMEILKEKAER